MRTTHSTRITHNTARIAGAGLAAAAAVALSVGPAFAADGFVSANLKPVAGNGVDGSGTAMVEVQGNKITVTMAANGLLPDNPHAAHIHFGAEARHECPVLSDDTNGDGHLTTSEGGPAYGDIVVSLTKTGDTSPDSGLAVDRFAATGDFEYERGDVQVTEDVAAAVVSGDAVVVIHGVDYDGDGTYSAGERGMSDLDDSLPGEATDPAICGVLNASQMGEMPSGGVSTGGGSTTGTENAGLIGLGAAAAVGGGIALIARRRTATDS